MAVDDGKDFQRAISVDSIVIYRHIYIYVCVCVCCCHCLTVATIHIQSLVLLPGELFVPGCFCLVSGRWMPMPREQPVASAAKQMAHALHGNLPLLAMIPIP